MSPNSAFRFYVNPVNMQIFSDTEWPKTPNCPLSHP
ncbi:hypothetical protein EYZ11_012976 [Aspergillus tanneri]|uniref:Uncharacterized protein n=1 Tax=Aspergillus tanneri TaxID=1220188 RepID=A0A4S3J105_9EURO|nr:hypothetical protein EYZ11_012976 [Aspergillus tanneri]